MSSRFLLYYIFGNNVKALAGEGQDPAGCGVRWIRGQNGGGQFPGGVGQSGREEKDRAQGREEQRGFCGERSEERQLQCVDTGAEAKLVMGQSEQEKQGGG